jgi:hypothetical protein
MFPTLKVVGVATACTLGAILYSETNFFAPPPPYLNAITKQGVSVAKFDKIYETLCKFSNQLQKGCSDKEKVASILFREDDSLRSWQTRYYALTSAIAIHFSFNCAVSYEKLLKNKNILIINQRNTKTKSSFDISDALASSHNVFMHTFSGKKDKTVCKVLEQYHSLTGQPLDAVIIKGHGNKFGIDLDESVELHYRSFGSERPLTGCFQKYLKNHAPIIFSSCNTGKGNETFPSIAEVAAAKTGHPVYAPTQLLMDMECRYDIDPLPLAEIKLSCVKNYIAENEPPNLKLGHYVKRFDSMDVPSKKND